MNSPRVQTRWKAQRTMSPTPNGVEIVFVSSGNEFVTFLVYCPDEFRFLEFTFRQLKQTAIKNINKLY